MNSVTAASVVPALIDIIRRAVSDLFGFEPVFIDYRMKTGLYFPFEKPEELGPDLLANAAAAHNYMKVM
ncbi:MAG: type III pantothenate kinase [Spirochaetales bacterium]|uniref:pantothenate kinase n=1 Tax=Candidatus Thalassospirochaeta sargassi TaxID=3119039 RepID=A0AAJ1ML22_9SPIO|nr:type III pantothenate kinase [Spirochaetales bacterium]